MCQFAGLTVPALVKDKPDLLDAQTYGSEGKDYFQQLENYLERVERRPPPPSAQDFPDLTFKVCECVYACALCMCVCAVYRCVLACVLGCVCACAIVFWCV